jgi:hypothetical protein
MDAEGGTSAAPLLNADATTPTPNQGRRRRRLLVLLFALSLAFLTLVRPLLAVILGEIHRQENLDAPCPRKGGVALVLGGRGSGSGENDGNSSSSSSFTPPRLVVWSGKKRGRLSGDADGELQGAVHVLELRGGSRSGGRGGGKKGKWKVATSTSSPSSPLRSAPSSVGTLRWSKEEKKRAST